MSHVTGTVATNATYVEENQTNATYMEENQCHHSDQLPVDMCDVQTSTKHIFSRWSLWQILDSILPTGGFAHSYGLEAAVQARVVPNAESLEAFAVNTVENTASLLLPFVYEANKHPNIENWIKLDLILHATLSNGVARKASIAQGSALLRVASTVFTEISDFKQMRTCARKPVMVHVHHASVFGVICGLLGFDSFTTQQAYLFVMLRDLLSASTRLNLIGPLEAASTQHRISKVAEKILKRHMDRPIEEAYQTAPVLDTAQGCHDYLFSRLFCS
ncbi:hypothetical protein SUGI_1081070 [Cryptomeria japonica]|uniref:urease accessory protein F n=1 Tax=Cryptomeria japonica TaxID=3369 RepID=UPI00241491DF|nr:urease accessory protein F [Cryptomeria japonica]GLJ50752.1 hypothetical protein SUGI_1081070 [Cryptomeria japonica]